jgi:myo-inositol 2-dehydrogenase/D-chiro-inositol 1-dehydrogenase
MSRTTFEPVKIGVVGLGNFGQKHALTLAGLAEADLVALVARRQESLDAVAGQLPGVPGWLDLERAIAESGAEAWVVANSTATHVPVAAALLAAGKAVLLEKPVAVTLAEAERLAPLVKPDSSNLMLGHIVLFNSEYLQLRDEARRRGPLFHINCTRHRPAANLVKFPGENPMVLTMVHDLYAVQALVRRAEPVRFSSQVHRAENGDCDLVLAQLQWADGLVASFAASFFTPAGMAPNGYDRMEVYGQGWMGRIEPNPRPIEVWDERARWPMPLEIRAVPDGPSGMMAAELRCFCRVVRGAQPVPAGATYADALQVQRWMDRLEACWKAAER